MILNEIGRSANSTFKRINQHLESNYGFKISEDVSDKDLVSIMEQIQDEITELKVKGDDAKVSPEISKRLLVLEGLRTLREFALVQFQSPKFDTVIGDLANFVVDMHLISSMHHGDFEKAMERAMDEYRSSKYRFPDDIIEQRVRQEVMSRLQSQAGQEAQPGSAEMTLSPEAMVFEDADDNIGDQEDEAKEDSEMNGIDESGKWIHTDPEKRGMFKGKSKADLEAQRASLKKKDAAHPGEVPEHDKEKMHQLNFAIRAKSKGGLEEDDPFGNVGKRSSGRGGYNAEIPDTAQAHHAMKQLNNPALSLEPQDEQVPMIRTPDGRLVPDPWKAQAAARRKGIVMKEQSLVKNLRRLLETEVSQAEVMMAAKGFAQELQEMVEKVGRLQNEDLPPVTDQMRETYGIESATAFQTQIYSAFQSVMDALYTAKNQVDDAVSSMAQTGQVGASIDMDKEVGGMPTDDMGADEMGADEMGDLDNLEADLEAGDEFGGAEEEEPLGRAKKMESTEALQKKILEMKRLVEKAKKLRESRG